MHRRLNVINSIVDYAICTEGQLFLHSQQSATYISIRTYIEFIDRLDAEANMISDSLIAPTAAHER